MKEVMIYTDGACSMNPGPGGWAAVLIYKGVEKEISGFEADTTNNRMELYSIIAALQLLKEPCNVRLFSDSAYAVNAFNRHWIDNWRRNGWQTSKKQPVENRDLWELLLEQFKVHKIEFKKVAGHAGDKYNERCDTLARAQIKTMQKN